jgi:hypothetical protein
MTAQPVTVPQPVHPLHALTTFELERYLHELEHALTVLPEHVTVRELLQGKLAEVLAEQLSRTKIAATFQGG